MNPMNDVITELKTSEFSMRRTLLTLLGAIGAFGVLTASYATADLPNVAPAAVAAEISVVR